MIGELLAPFSSLMSQTACLVGMPHRLVEIKGLALACVADERMLRPTT